VEKGLDILEAVVDSPEGLGVRALAHRLHINATSVHNIAGTLTGRGYLRQDEQTRRYRLGLMAMMLGQHTGYPAVLGEVARGLLRQLSRELDESILLAALERHHVIRVEYLPSSQALRVEEPEDLNPIAYCTACGKVLLAAMTPSSLDDYFRMTPLKRYTAGTLTDTAALLEQLGLIREQGFAEADGEMSEGIVALAVPVQDPWGKTIAALGASVPSVRMNEGLRSKTMSELRRAAEQISRAWRSNSEAAGGKKLERSAR
jgi:DNA-binding IclR family transcriptional regulator